MLRKGDLLLCIIKHREVHGSDFNIGEYYKITSIDDEKLYVQASSFSVCFSRGTGQIDKVIPHYGYIHHYFSNKHNVRQRKLEQLISQ